MLSGFMLGLLGMVTMFGGTRFWAAGPSVVLMLCLVCGHLCFTLKQLGRTQGRMGLPPDFLFWLPVLMYVAFRAAFSTPVTFETWTEFGFLWIAWMVYGVMADLGNQTKAWVWAAFILLAVVCFHSLWAVSQHWHGTRMVLWVPRPAQYGMRASGSYICPNHFAHFLLMGLVVAFGCLFTPRAPLSLRFFSGYVLIPSCGVLVLTHSRSGMIGAFAGLSVVGIGLAMRRGWKRVLLTLLGLAAAAALMIYLLLQFYPPMRARMVRDIQDNIRISQVWPDTWSMIQSEGLWGAGPGVYAQVFEKYREHFSSASLYLEYAHNEFLHTLAEYGWPVSLWMLGLVLWMGLSWMRAGVQSPSRSAAMIPFTMAGLLAGSLAHAVFDFNLHIPANGFLLTGLLGLLYGQGCYQGLWKPRVFSGWPLRAGLIALALSGLMFLPYVVRLSVGSWHEYRMRQAIEAGQAEIQYRHAALMRDWMPWYARGWTQKGNEYRGKAFFLRFNPLERQEAIAESRNAYEMALSKNSHEKLALAGLVELARMENRPEEALKLILRLRNKAPYDLQVRIMHGLILRELDRPAEALKVFEDAQRMQGGNTLQIQLNIRQLRKILQSESPQARLSIFNQLSVDRMVFCTI